MSEGRILSVKQAKLGVAVGESRVTGGEAVADALIRNGVDTIFGIPGIQLDALYDAFHHRGSKLKVLHTRHEQGAAYMAMGYAQSSDRTGVFAVVPGPGLLNSLTALADAASANLPVLGITGQIPSERIGQGLGFPHELKDQQAVISGIIDWVRRANHPSEVPRLVDAAFRQMRQPRRRPALLEIPPDILAQKSAVLPLSAAPASQAAPPPDLEAIAAAAASLARAKAPLIMVGGGAMGAPAAVRRLAEKLSAPVVMTQNGRGVIPDDHPLAFNMLCGQEFWREADLVVAIGTRMVTPLLSWDRADMELIRIDVDPVQITKPRASRHAIVADATAALDALCDELDATSAAAAAWDFRELAAPVIRRLEELEPVAGFARAVRDAVPRDAIFVSDITQFGVYARFALPVYTPKSYLLPGYQATLGWAYPAALGAQVANPGRKVVTFAGDGGFLFNIQELATAVQHRIPVVAIVFNNSRFGNVHMIQAKNYGGRHIATELKNPDFVALARAFGMAAVRADTPEALGAALKDALSAGAPALIEVVVGDLPDVWQFVKKPASQGERR
jgi:acetolactate synthase I/II/III large subunit